MRVPYSQLLATLECVLLNEGFERGRAGRCAELFAQSSRDGVYSHGLNRFPLFVSMVRAGVVNLHAEPTLVCASGPIERWNGQGGPGNLNAFQCMERAIRLARQHGMGCVALANTNHWMRGGSYGWQAAESGVIAICWTNTGPNLPPWGTDRTLLGNNPLVIAVPRRSGHVVLDMAMSQFSYGALASHRMRGELLPVEGGYGVEGKLTRVPGEIEASKRPLPIGYWKGSGLALMLDLIAGILSEGSTTHQIPSEPEKETRLSQMFLAFDPARLGGAEKDIAEDVIRHFRESTEAGTSNTRYPGERVLRTRLENMENGVPVEPSIWRHVQELAS
jgi:3-dehydro-L-gulonate 2-dehydrogenase